MTKPKGIHATFETTCTCGSELTVTNGRIDRHECRERLDLDAIQFPEAN